MPTPTTRPPILTVQAQDLSCPIEPTLAAREYGSDFGTFLQHSPEHLDFIPRPSSGYGCAWIVVTILTVLVVLVLARILVGQWSGHWAPDPAVWAFLFLITSCLVIAVVSLVRYRPLRLRFDRRVGEVRAGAHLLCKVDEIVAIQVVNDKLYCRHFFVEVDQINFAYLKDREPKRRNLVTMSGDDRAIRIGIARLDREQLFHDARRLAAFLGVPLVDQIEAMAVLAIPQP
jgi:hypothetical protein